MKQNGYISFNDIQLLVFVINFVEIYMFLNNRVNQNGGKALDWGKSLRYCQSENSDLKMKYVDCNKNDKQPFSFTN